MPGTLPSLAISNGTIKRALTQIQKRETPQLSLSDDVTKAVCAYSPILKLLSIFFGTRPRYAREDAQKSAIVFDLVRKLSAVQSNDDKIEITVKGSDFDDGNGGHYADCKITLTHFNGGVYVHIDGDDQPPEKIMDGSLTDLRDAVNHIMNQSPKTVTRNEMEYHKQSPFGSDAKPSTLNVTYNGNTYSTNKLNGIVGYDKGKTYNF